MKLSNFSLSAFSLSSRISTPGLDNDTLHGFEYTPGQNDDRVDFIGNMAYNVQKPIQSAMRPFEELISTKQRWYQHDDVAVRLDGSASHLTDPNYLQKVSIPQFWYGSIFDSVRNKVQVWFSLVPVDWMMYVAPQAVTRYRGYRDANGFARSRSGYKYPTNNQLIEMQASAQLTSSDLFVMPFYLYNALALLMLHDLGRRNAQAVWGGLQGGGTYGNITSGKTDTLKVHSGEVPADAETAGYKSFRWRFIENFYADSWQLLFGVYVKTINSVRRVCVCGDYYKGNTNNVLSADYIQVSDLPSVSDWVKDVWLPWITVKTQGATSTTGYGDYSYNNTQDMAILVAGGYSYYGAYAGPFALLSSRVASSRFSDASALFASIDRAPAALQIAKPALMF